MKIKKWSLSLFLLFLYLTPDTCLAQSGFYLGYKLSFYNLFSPGLYAFRRNHQFCLGYQSPQISSFGVEAQYNWIDEVKGSVSTHNLTCWIISVKGIFNQDEVRLRYTYFVNLLNPLLNRGVIGLEYSKLLNSKDFVGMARAGIGFSRKFLPIYGLNLFYLPGSNTNINLKFNWLEDNEDNPEFPFKFPLTLGFGGRFTSQGSYALSNIGEGLGFEYVWDPAKSYLVSTSESKLTHYWFKGYIWDKFWF